MLLIFEFIQKTILFGPAFGPIVAALALWSMSAPQTRSEEVEPWDIS